MRLTAWRSVAHRRGRPLRATHGPSQGRTIVDGGGFTLVEVLVALVVLAVGMLGLAVLLVDGLRGSRGAIEHTQAANLAADVAERMRSNRAAASAYDTADGTPDPSVEPACDDPAGPCDPLALASHDLRRWLDDVAATLPDGRGTVEVEHRAVESRRGIVTLHWTPAGESPATYTLVVDL
jgi:type IV pilus assembly protein PilV